MRPEEGFSEHRLAVVRHPASNDRATTLNSFRWRQAVVSRMLRRRATDDERLVDADDLAVGRRMSLPFPPVDHRAPLLLGIAFLLDGEQRAIIDGVSQFRAGDDLGPLRGF